MITIRVTREWQYATEEASRDIYELEYDPEDDGYNPSVVRDIRDCVMSMVPDRDDTEAGELTEFEETASTEQDKTE